MSAEDKNVTYRLHLTVSELDRKDGVKIHSDYRNTKYTDLESNAKYIEVNNHLFKDDEVKYFTDVFEFAKDSVALDTLPEGEEAWKSVSWIATAGNMYIDKGVGSEFLTRESLFSKYDDVTIEFTFSIDEVGADNYGPDKVDDRNQVTYPVKYETYPGSGLYTVADEKYTVNKGDDIVKLVTSGEYTELPLYEEVEYDKDDNEYVLQYEIKEDVIVAKWVKEGSARFVNQVKEEVEYDELDANKDGVVSCEEALGKGWVWNNETSACELKGSSNTGSYVPNTATK